MLQRASTSGTWESTLAPNKNSLLVGIGRNRNVILLSIIGTTNLSFFDIVSDKYCICKRSCLGYLVFFLLWNYISPCRYIWLRAFCYTKNSNCHGWKILCASRKYFFISSSSWSGRCYVEITSVFSGQITIMDDSAPPWTDCGGVVTRRRRKYF